MVFSSDLERRKNPDVQTLQLYVEYLFKPKKFGRTTANYKGSEKEEKVSRDLPGFSLTLRPRKIQTFLSYYYYFFF